MVWGSRVAGCRVWVFGVQGGLRELWGCRAASCRPFLVFETLGALTCQSPTLRTQKHTLCFVVAMLEPLFYASLKEYMNGQFSSYPEQKGPPYNRTPQKEPEFREVTQ